MIANIIPGEQKAEELGILKDIVIQRLNIMDIDRFDVLKHKSFDFAMECRPRPDPKIWKPKKKLMRRNPWKFETSVFKDWKFDNEVMNTNHRSMLIYSRFTILGHRESLL